MQLQAQLDKMIPQAEESLRVCITGPEGHPVTLEWPLVYDGLSSVSELFDRRLKEINERIIADAGLLDHLSDRQKILFYRGFDILYPSERVEGLEMPPEVAQQMKLQISKHTGSGEALTFELSGFEGPFDVAIGLRKALEAIDDRLMYENMKKQEFSLFYGELSHEDKLTLQIAYDVLFGRTQAENAVMRLEAHRKEQEEQALQSVPQDDTELL